MFISTAYAANGVNSLFKNDSTISDYFFSQFQNLTPLKIAIGLAMGCLVGLIIAFVYKRCYRGVLYSPTFAMTLMMLTLITTPVVMCIKKDPMDTAYMFWALTMGILLGAELYVHALAVVLCIGLILMLMTFVRFRNPNAYLLVVHYDDYAEQEITQLLRRTVRQRKLRSKTVTRSGAEMTVEVRLDSKQDLVSAVLNIEGVHDATLVACQVEAGS